MSPRQKIFSKKGMFARFVAGAALLAALSAGPAGRSVRAATGAPARPPAEAPEDPVLLAMQAELERSKAQLKMDGVQAPYYIEYRVGDVDDYSAEAIFGTLRQEQRYHVRFVRVVVRIGDYRLDSYYGQGQGVVDSMPVDNDLLAFRHQLWLATDKAYKAASEALTAKLALLKQYSIEQTVEDYSRASAVVSIEPLAHMDRDVTRWRKALESTTALYRKFPEVQSVDASLRFNTLNQYLVTSEGTMTRHGRSLYQITLSGSTQAPDGMRLDRSPYFLVSDQRELPGEEKLLAETSKMLETLTRLRAAPIVEEEYRGPVLFAADAANDVVAGLVANNVLGRKPAPNVPARTVGSYANSYKSRVLPDFLSVVDDPTLKTFGGTTLVGSYAVDDEGVKVAPVSVIENGLLVNYLLGRQPIRDFPASNGHGRTGGGGFPGPSIGNLILKSSQSLSHDALRKKLLEMCQAQSKPYGYYVETMGPRLAPRLLYRVWVKDGREEIVRGAIFSELDTRGLRNEVLAVGDDPEVSNRPGPTPTTVISPSMLFAELEVKRADSSNDKLPEYGPPPLSPPK